jgi:DNA polymerase-3 subunit epsilon
MSRRPRSIRRAITKITGIDAAMAAGKSIDPDDVTAFAGHAVVVIAHNATFDRLLIKKAYSVFA